MKLTKDDVHKLFDFLNKLYSSKPYPRDVGTIAIWETVLKPWPYKQVRDAVLKRTQTTHFRPDPAEIVAFLPALEASSPSQADKPSPAMMEAVKQGQAEHQATVERCRMMGIPTLAEARAQGMSVKEWHDMVGDDSPVDGV